MEIEFEDCSMTYLQPKVREIVAHFEKPIPKEQALIVDEAMMLQYADVVADIKALEKTKEHMKPLLLSQRCGNEKTAVVGKAMLCFQTVEDTVGFDYEAAYKAQIGEPTAEDKKLYSKVVRKGYTSVEVKKL